MKKTFLDPKTIQSKNKLRPKGCMRTISGRHIPVERMMPGYTIQFYCSACGLIDDIGIFTDYLYPNRSKINDTKYED